MKLRETKKRFAALGLTAFRSVMYVGAATAADDGYSVSYF